MEYTKGILVYISQDKLFSGFEGFGMATTVARFQIFGILLWRMQDDKNLLSQAELALPDIF